MKKTIFLFVLMAFIMSVQSQVVVKQSKAKKKVEVPELVKNAFKAKYPSITKVKWGIEKAGEYEAEFKINKAEVSVLYDEKGNILETETEIKTSELPTAVLRSIEKDFAGYKIEEAEKNESKGVITYEVEVEKGKLEYELTYDANGKLLKKEEEKEGKNKD